jgi:hypothetical protein
MINKKPHRKIAIDAFDNMCPHLFPLYKPKAATKSPIVDNGDKNKTVNVVSPNNNLKSKLPNVRTRDISDTMEYAEYRNEVIPMAIAVIFNFLMFIILKHNGLISRTAFCVG